MALIKPGLTEEQKKEFLEAMNAPIVDEYGNKGADRVSNKLEREKQNELFKSIRI